MQRDLSNEFLELYDAYADVVFRMCLAKVSSREEAKDLAQETFVRVWDRLQGGGSRISNLRAFLFTVARNLIKDYYKKKKPILAGDLPEGTFEQVAVTADAETMSDAKLALGAIADLPVPYRDAVHLHLVEGYSITEVADMLSERPNTISVRVKRGIEKVRGTLRTTTL